MKSYEIQEFGIDKLAIVERDTPKPGPGEVLVRMRAASINYRDIMMVEGAYNPKLKLPLVPFSDGAGEVAAVGEGVTKWVAGDRVCPIFMQGWIDGPVDYQKARTTLGGDLDGCLREFAVFNQEGLVAMPSHLSFGEASTLPCAGVTAWHAVTVSGQVGRGETVLVQGTGGVSMFALQFAKLFEANVIATSSSDGKLERARELGADSIINYKEREDWDNAALELTDKIGVDHVIEVGGPGTLQRSMRAVRMGGHIAVIGVVAGQGEFTTVPIFMKSLKLQGIFVGSRQMFEAMNAEIERSGMTPEVDKVYPFIEVGDALEYVKAGLHFGKVVVSIGE
jgi:NADPH:quinone reductase and related Zn-dependent oxidoreductases